MINMLRAAVLAGGVLTSIMLATGGALAATPRDALVMAWNLDGLITFDPAQIAEVNGNDIIRNVCEPLVNYDLGDVSKMVPHNAESWSVSDDGLTLTFKLRGDLKFPNGRTAMAHDAEWSMHRVVHLGFGNSANFTQWGFAKDKLAEQIKATDDRTLVIKLDRPYPVGLLLDEPTSALDVSVQAEILNLLVELRQRLGLTCILVSHDLAVVAHMCDRLGVMNHGRLLEELPVSALAHGNTTNPYTRQLLTASLGYDRRLAADAIEG